MLKLTIKPGEFINIGDDVRVIYSGGSEGNIHLLIDAPRELNIVRSKVLQETVLTALILIRKLQDSYHLTTLSRDFLLKH